MTAGDIDRIAAAPEITIEAGPSGDRVGAIVWVVEHAGDLYVRSYRGDRGRWYRRALAEPDVTVRLGAGRVALRAVPVDDPAEIEGASDGFRRKYGDMGEWLDAMLVPEVLPTTLRLEPRR